jgi:hypothetical protein
VWKKNRLAVTDSPPLHKLLGIGAKLLMVRALFDRTEVGAIRLPGAGFRDFSPISAGFLTGFSAGSPEN